MHTKSQKDLYQLLSEISAALEEEYTAEDVKWEGSPFGWLKSRPSRQVGAIGERIIERLCRSQGFKVARSPDADADRIISGMRVEIKFSTLWSGGFYKFQQLRDQNYSVAFCLGVSPLEAHAWVLPKEVIMTGWGSYDGLDSQHGGRSGTDTAWLTVDPVSVPTWLKPYGGSLKDAFSVFEGIVNS